MGRRRGIIAEICGLITNSISAPAWPSIPPSLLISSLHFFCWRLLVSNNQKPLSVDRISLAPPPSMPQLSLFQLSPLDQGDVFVHVCACWGWGGDGAAERARAPMWWLHACVRTLTGGCMALSVEGWQWWRVPYQDFCKQAHSRNGCSHTHVPAHKRLRTRRYTLTKRPGSNVIMPGLADSQWRRRTLRSGVLREGRGPCVIRSDTDTHKPAPHQTRDQKQHGELHRPSLPGLTRTPGTDLTIFLFS